MSKTPKLRFKGFTEDWESKTVKELMNEKVIEQPLDGNHGEIHPTTNDYVKTGIPFIMASDIQNGKINYSKCKYISEETAKGLRKGFAKEGDVLITHKATIGELAMVKNLNTEYMVLTPQVTYYRIRNYALLSNIYLKSYFESPSFMSVFKKLATDGSTRSYIGITKQQNLNIKYPNIEEQEKIASLFSLIDDKICLQGEKVEALKNYKKGMMQKIFSRELRFKDDEGRDYPDWREKKLKSILKEVSEKTKENNQYEVISSTTNGLFLQKEYFNREIASSDNTGYKILRRNQVVLSPQNLWMGNINFNDKYDIGIVSPSYKIFDINDDFDNKYIGYILRTPRSFYEFMQSSEQGASIVRRNLNIDLFNEISFNMPCEEEQKKIAEFIGSIDLKIEKEQSKLDSLNVYKKGLLQQMFV